MRRLATLIAAIVLGISGSGTASSQEIDGCPEGTYSVVFSPDGRTLSILFDAFQVELTAGAGQALTTCHLHIPLQLPPDTSIGVHRFDYRGFAHVAARQQFELSVVYGFNSGRDHSFRRQFRGEYDQDFTFTQTIGGGLMRRVGCGAEAALDIDATLALNANGQPGDALGTLDTGDAGPRGGLVYYFEFRPCGPQPNNP